MSNFASLRSGLRSEVVPQSHADLLFEAVKELALIAQAVYVLHAETKEATALSAPLPAGLHGHVSAEIDFLTEASVDG